MERLIVHCIGFVIDRVPYAIGRVAVFLFTFDSVNCEPWKPVIWDAAPFSKPWCTRINGETYVTHWGTRWAGWIAFIVLLAALVVMGFMWILKL